MGGKKKKKSREERTGVGQGVNARPRTRGPGWPTSPGPESLAIHGFPKLWGRRPRRSPACRSTSGTRSTDPQLHRSQVTGLGRAGRTRVSSSPGHSGNRGSGLGAQVIVPPAPSVPGPPAPGVPVDLKHQAPGHRCAGRPRAPSAEPRGPQPPACRSASSPTSPGPPGSRCAGRPRILGSSGPQCAGRPQVLGSTACWSTSGPRVPGSPGPRHAGRPRAPSLGVLIPRRAGRPRVPGSPGPRVPRSPGPPVPSVLVGLASRVALSPGPRSPLCWSTESHVAGSPGFAVCWSASGPRVLGSTACWSTSGPRVPGMLVDLERRASGSSSPGVPVGLESRVPGVPRSPGPPVPGVLVGLASRVALSPGPRSPLCWSTSSPTSPRRQVATSPGRAGRPQNDWT